MWNRLVITQSKYAESLFIEEFELQILYCWILNLIKDEYWEYWGQSCACLITKSATALEQLMILRKTRKVVGAKESGTVYMKAGFIISFFLKLNLYIHIGEIKQPDANYIQRCRQG